MAVRFNKIEVPQNGEKIRFNPDGSIDCPDNPIICFIEGDGTGPDIWRATQPVLDEAVKLAYNGKKKIEWLEVYAGEKANRVYEKEIWLPEETIDAIREYRVAIKGPLTTPVGGGFRSLNVTLRQRLDLYACVRPVRHYNGVPSPVKHPEYLDVVIFRENTEDVYAGIEWQAHSNEADRLIEFINTNFNKNIRPGSGIGIKPISEFATKRLMRMAIKYALKEGRRVITAVHKGNIMKYTEGSFKEWCFQEARENFRDVVVFEDELWEKYEGNLPEGKVLVNDRIADAMFQQVLLRPKEYSVIITPNLNGDYLSDACAAQVGGLGMAPGSNIGDGIALFEATHGTAPKYAGLDKVNPSSLILSGVMMLKYIGWKEAGELIERALERTIMNKTVTYDLERQLEGATKLKCSEFGQKIVENMKFFV